MESLLSSPYAIASLAILLVLFLFHRYLKQRKLKFPPGPKPWPIIGNLNLISSLPHRSIHDLALQYGPLMQIRFGSVPIVVGSTVEMAKTFLKTMDLNFVERPKFAAGKYTTFNYSDITWAPYGAYWRQARRMCVMELFSPKRLESYKYIREEETKSLVKELHKSSGKPIVLKEYLSTASLNVISRMVLGKNYLEESEEDNGGITPGEFRKMLDELILLNGVLNIGDYIGWLDFLDLQGYVKRMKVLSKKFDHFLEQVLEWHISRRRRIADDHNNYATNKEKSVVDVLLDLSEDLTLEVKLERHGVKAFTQDLLAGGTESTTVTVEWALSEILKNPHIFKKATEELDRVIGKTRWIEEKDIENLPYVQAIVKETMRLHPVVPLLIPRCTREDCKVAGYDILKGTIVLVSVWSIGRDPTLWDEPNVFLPERFLGKDIDIKGHDFELLPFGAGRRMCPGYALGTKEIQANLANLLHGFDWKLPENMLPEELEMDELFGLSTSKKIPLSTIVEPRLPLERYYL